MAKAYHFFIRVLFITLCPGVAFANSAGHKNTRRYTRQHSAVIKSDEAFEHDLFFYRPAALIPFPYLVLPVNFGQLGNADIRASVRATYYSQVGVRELTGHNDGKAVEMYLRYCGLKKGEPWCASFVCWGLGQNHVPNPRAGFCPNLFTKKSTIWKRNATGWLTPMAGDAGGLYFAEKGRIAHAFFIDVWGAKTTVTVEGNTNEGGSREGDGVYRKIRLTRQIYAVARFIKT